MPLIALLQRVATAGPPANPQKVKQLHGDDALGIWEFKSYQHRVFFFYGKEAPPAALPTIIMTNGYRKKTKRTDRNQIRRAQDQRRLYWSGAGEPE